MNEIITKLAGVTFNDCQKNLKLFGNPSINTFDMRREAQNQYDPNAIWVGTGTYHMGYLPKPLAQKIAPIMDGGKRFMAEYVALNQSEFYKTVGLTIKIIEINN